MEIKWRVEENEEENVLLKTFLKKRQISKRVLTKVKYRGGSLKVNGHHVRVREELSHGDVVSMTIPQEMGSVNLSSSSTSVDVLYEDDHYLFINKPSGVASVPSSVHPVNTIANRVKGYIEQNDYYHQTVHIVSRLDRDTSGVMIFAKHTLAHSFMDRLLKEKEIYKEYVAYVKGNLQKDHGFIDQPIGREEGSIIKRCVDKAGKPSVTEYWTTDRFLEATRVKVQLHTGRTHQIRVHFAHLNHALLGDTLYGDEETRIIDRQALHCSCIRFTHPFTHQKVIVQAELPEDMTNLEHKLKDRLDV
ncbi:RluA family pseudouridine synthase [Alkalibacterium thalassium]|uniref:Pseudouridine synthase n=1 Tax=Alkalibacterium thalassium TaxID=426701 RepID=A0A1G8W8M4_9LACT|nr:RluA family pseudouridine synthase [Alkalibacterium thalassium]SDJ74075.1 23S rRNA pseudouridine1911/1915/1917 synthase [Alkalibacterium thalassium]